MCRARHPFAAHGASRSPLRRAALVQAASRKLPPGESGKPDPRRGARGRRARRVDPLLLLRIPAHPPRLPPDPDLPPQRARHRFAGLSHRRDPRGLSRSGKLCQRASWSRSARPRALAADVRASRRSAPPDAPRHRHGPAATNTFSAHSSKRTRSKRNSNLEHAALATFTDLSLSPNPFRARAYEELAKHYEHREKNFRMALECVRAARQIEDSAARANRQRRLEAKSSTRRVSAMLV